MIFKKLLLLNFTILGFSLNAESLKYFDHYYQKIENQNLNIQLQKKKIEKLQIQIEQKKSLFTSPLYLDLNAKKGNQIQPFNLYLNQPSINQKLNEYIIQISKIIDILNSQTLEREIYEIQKKLENSNLILINKQIKNQFIKSYLTAIFLKNMMEHLKEHIDKFEKLKKRFQYQYFDKKLGFYSLAALEMGITILQNEYNETQNYFLKEIEILNILLNQENQNLKLDNFEEIINIIPKRIPTTKETLLNSYKESPLYEIEKAHLEISEKKLILAKNQKWNQLEIFLNYGIRNLGNYNSYVYSYSNPEKENYWSFGLKIPIPYGSELDSYPKIQEKEIEYQALKIKQLELEFKNQISTYYDIFQKDNKQLFHNLEIINKYEPLLKTLENSLISRRITFFEYWGEHERYHSLLRSSISLLESTLSSFYYLEYLTGKELSEENL